MEFTTQYLLKRCMEEQPRQLYIYMDSGSTLTYTHTRAHLFTQTPHTVYGWIGLVFSLSIACLAFYRHFQFHHSCRPFVRSFIDVVACHALNPILMRVCVCACVYVCALLSLSFSFSLPVCLNVNLCVRCFFSLSHTVGNTENRIRPHLCQWKWTKKKITAPHNVWQFLSFIIQILFDFLLLLLFIT